MQSICGGDCSSFLWGVGPRLGGEGYCSIYSGIDVRCYVGIGIFLFFMIK